MSKFDNYGGVSHDPAFDGGDPIDWNPCDHIGDIDDDAVWSTTYADPADWLEAEVMALVFEVEVPPHDEEGNATDGSPYIIPDDLIGAKTCYVAGCYFDWGHYCDGLYGYCPKDTPLEEAIMRAQNACDGPLEAPGPWLVSDKKAWLPGNPDVDIDDTDSDNLVARLVYEMEGEMEPYVSELIPFSNDQGPAKPLWLYAKKMGWHTAPPNAKWVMFTKRTDDPKLSYLEQRLEDRGIPSRRNGESFHAPLLEVPDDFLEVAWGILDKKINHQGVEVRFDDIPDDDAMFGSNTQDIARDQPHPEDYDEGKDKGGTAI